VCERSVDIYIYCTTSKEAFVRSTVAVVVNTFIKSARSFSVLFLGKGEVADEDAPRGKGREENEEKREGKEGMHFQVCSAAPLEEEL